MRGTLRALLLSLLVAAAPAAVAQTHRVAVVVGNNAGVRERAPLHFAEIDAGKVARTLVELGGVLPRDVFLLQGRPLASVEQALAQATQRVATLRREGRVVLLFYFSGHSDGESLELGRERLTFAELRRWIGQTGAEVKLAIIDSCKSGALILPKGGRPDEPFQMRLTDDMASSGEVLLTSSAADENALESKEIGGSFFTHHFLSGLRGVADLSGDGLVTLAEAYQHAYTHTVSSTAATMAGPQHPEYDFRLSGRGELVLTELSHPRAALELPPDYDRLLVIDVARDQVLAEVPAGAGRRVVVPTGDLRVRAMRGDRAYVARFSVADHEVRQVRSDELSPAQRTQSLAKGGETSDRFVLTPYGQAVVALAVVAGLGIVAGASTGGAAIEAHEGYNASCASLCDLGRYRTLQTVALSTDVLLGVAASAAVTATILYAARPRRRHFTIAPTIAPQAAMIWCSVSY